MPTIKSLVIPSLRSRWSRCVDAAGPRAESEAGPTQRGGPDTAPWGLTVSAGRGEQANSPEFSNEAVLKTDLGNHEQGRRGCSHEHLAKPSFRAMHMPWARKPQCYQATS
jgi:hypothetical protein